MRIEQIVRAFDTSGDLNRCINDLDDFMLEEIREAYLAGFRITDEDWNGARLSREINPREFAQMMEHYKLEHYE